MTEEDFRKFDKETWLRFYKHFNGLDKDLFTCLTTIERRVQIDKLMEKSRDIHEQMKLIESNDKKVIEYCRLLQRSLQIHKKPDKLFGFK